MKKERENKQLQLRKKRKKRVRKRLAEIVAIKPQMEKMIEL